MHTVSGIQSSMRHTAAHAASRHTRNTHSQAVMHAPCTQSVIEQKTTWSHDRHIVRQAGLRKDSRADGQTEKETHMRTADSTVYRAAEAGVWQEQR